MSGDFFPMQLTYKVTTPKCLPKNVNFPGDWQITCTKNHWSNEATMMDYIAKIVVPYVTEKRKELKLSDDHLALAIFDVFKGQCTESVFKILEESLDLSVNKSAKDFMKSKFQEWYGGIICKQLEEEIEEEVDMRLSVMKPLTANWIIDFYHYMERFLSMVLMLQASRTCMLLLDNNATLYICMVQVYG